MTLWAKHKSEAPFAFILLVCVIVSLQLSKLIPAAYFDTVLAPVLISCSATLTLGGAWIMFRHAGGLRVRRVWGWSLLVWGVSDSVYIFSWMTSAAPLMNMGAYQLTTLELLLANLLGWSLLLYPTEALRPGWMTARRALIQILPMAALGALDYFVPFNMQPIITLYPFILIAMLLKHLKEYRTWCEENFSSLDDIDSAWIVRYLIMFALVGLVYMYMCFSHNPTRGFTQLWLSIMMFAYGTEQILFRKDPWALVHPAGQPQEEEAAAETEAAPAGPDAAYRVTLEKWMESEKPYLNPDFKLLDLQNVLPMNRTYLSQFIHNEYDCNFYQFVNGYRIREAQRMKIEHPEMKMSDISASCGFSSPSVFTRTFNAVTGLTPSEWSKTLDSA